MKLVRDVLRKERPVLGLTAGTTPIGLYKEMIEGYQSGELSYRNVMNDDTLIFGGILTNICT